MTLCHTLRYSKHAKKANRQMYSLLVDQIEDPQVQAIVSIKRQDVSQGRKLDYTEALDAHHGMLRNLNRQ